jgi:cation diffusion facilitator family transporter
MTAETMDRLKLRRFAKLSIAAAIFTIGLKSAAYLLTGSIGLLSDALESMVNVIGALLAFWMLTIAARPANRDHAFGYSKAEYFSSGAEGGLILIAAAGIGLTSIQRLISPEPLEQVGVGLIVSAVASVVNLVTAQILKKAGKQYHSITLEADAVHLMTDVWTSVGVIAGVGTVALTGWQRLDPIIAILVAINIVRSGIQIVRRSALGLLDRSLPIEEHDIICKTLEPFKKNGIEIHALKTREAGARKFVSFHVVVPGNWTVHEGHQYLEKIEADVCKALPNVSVFTHLESVDDPASYDDEDLDRI